MELKTQAILIGREAKLQFHKIPNLKLIIGRVVKLKVKHAAQDPLAARKSGNLIWESS